MRLPPLPPAALSLVDRPSALSRAIGYAVNITETDVVTGGTTVYAGSVVAVDEVKHTVRVLFEQNEQNSPRPGLSPRPRDVDAYALSGAAGADADADTEDYHFDAPHVAWVAPPMSSRSLVARPAAVDHAVGYIVQVGLGQL